MDYDEAHPHLYPHAYEGRNVGPRDAGVRAFLGFLIGGTGLGVFLLPIQDKLLYAWFPMLVAAYLLWTGLTGKDPIYEEWEISTIEFEGER